MRQPATLLASALSALLFVACGDDNAAGGGPALELLDASGSADTGTIDTGSVGTDTGAEDTIVEDTNGSAEDTTVADTTVEDTTVEDTNGSADTTVEDTTVEDTTLPPADIIINEVSCRDAEWIELLNLSDRDQDLSNWRIADGPIDLNPGFLNGKVIPALGRLILTEGRGQGDAAIGQTIAALIREEVERTAREPTLLAMAKLDADRAHRLIIAAFELSAGDGRASRVARIWACMAATSASVGVRPVPMAQTGS